MDDWVDPQTFMFFYQGKAKEMSIVSSKSGATSNNFALVLQLTSR